MTGADTAKLYIDQFLKTATSGYVVAEYALVEDRVRLCCLKCDQTLTCSYFKSPGELEWSVQEFIKLHVHRPGEKKRAGNRTATGVEVMRSITGRRFR